MKHFVKESALMLADEEQPTMSLLQVMLEKAQGEREGCSTQDPSTIAAIGLGVSETELRTAFDRFDINRDKTVEFEEGALFVPVWRMHEKIVCTT